jgi:hypothetical protein
MTRTIGRTLLLSAVAVLMLHCGARAEEESAANREKNAVQLRRAIAQEASALGRIPEFQKELNNQIKYELAVDIPLDKALDELLTQHGILYVVNEAAFGPDNKDVLKKTMVETIDPVEGLTRADILKRLIGKIPNDGDKTAPTYVLRPRHLEITTRGAMMHEFYPGRLYAHLPSLAYAAFKQTPLREALVELAHATESTVVLDPKSAEAAKTKVTAEFLGVPADAAVQVLADMAGLKLVRLETVYYVTTPENAALLRKEVNKRRLDLNKAAVGDYDATDLPIIP